MDKWTPRASIARGPCVLAGIAALAAQTAGFAASEPDPAQLAAVGSAMAAKLVCSGVFVSGRKLADVVANDVNKLSPLAFEAQYEVDAAGKVITTKLAGATAQALYRPGVGCTLLSQTDRDSLLRQSQQIRKRSEQRPRKPWPEGELVDLRRLAKGIDSRALNAAVARAFDEDTANHDIDTRAIVVVHDGQIVAERYAPGFGSQTPMLGWSASKSVLATVVGALITDGKLAMDQLALAPEWRQPVDKRREITLDQLLRMSSGLQFREPYVPGSDSSTMLFQTGDMAAYAAKRPLAHDPGTVWRYSSGDTAILSRVVLQTLGGALRDYHDYARTRIFEPAGMLSFVLEPDATGAFVGSSYAYGAARDWARFGLLYLNRGMANGHRILSEQWVDYVRTPAPADPHSYSGAHFWLNVRRPPGAGEREYPHLPEDAYMAHGHNEQLVAVVPSRRAVIVRLGWTTGAAKFDIDTHFGAILQSLPQ